MNKKEINVKGCVTDSATRMPMADAKITLLCWYHAGWDKTDYVSVDTVADRNGCFNAKFEEGYKVVVAGVANKYNPNLRASDELIGNNIEINLELKKRIDTTDVSNSINLRNYIVQNSSN
ncbi:MAG: hypothetical protein INR73_02995 [Williamsia sp.]|nr:hypothetical protein [Williamsia sp.]